MRAPHVRNDRMAKRHPLVEALSERCHIRQSLGAQPFAVWIKPCDTWQVWRFCPTLEEAREQAECWGPA